MLYCRRKLNENYSGYKLSFSVDPSKNAMGKELQEV